VPSLLNGIRVAAFAWYGVKIRVIFGVRFERRKVDKKANLHENWNMQTLFWSLLNISAKFHQNWSLQFWAIPFQSWCVFWDTVYMLLHISLLLYLFHNIQLEWHCIAYCADVPLRNYSLTHSCVHRYKSPVISTHQLHFHAFLFLSRKKIIKWCWVISTPCHFVFQ